MNLQWATDARDKRPGADLVEYATADLKENYRAYYEAWRSGVAAAAGKK